VQTLTEFSHRDLSAAAVKSKSNRGGRGGAHDESQLDSVAHKLD